MSTDRVFKALALGLGLAKGGKGQQPSIFKEILDQKTAEKQLLGQKKRRFPTNSSVSKSNSQDSNSAGEQKDGKPTRSKKKRSRSFETEQEANTFRNKKMIKVYGSGVAFPIKKFSHLSSLEVSDCLLDQIGACGYSKPTLVQMQGIPVLLSRRDAFIIAPTGSGKTLAFLVGIIQRIIDEKYGTTGAERNIVRGLIIAPTKELAHQICQEAKRLLPETVDDAGKQLVKVALVEKSLVNNWKEESAQGKAVVYPDLLVSSPLRLIQAVEAGIINLDKVQMVVLDEADKLLELGYLEQLDTILGQMQAGNRSIQKVLFSATIPTGIEQVARTFMAVDPIRVVIGKANASVKSIDQKLLFVGQESGKLMAIKQMLTEGLKPPAIIFTETIDKAKKLFNELVYHGISVDIIHSDRTATERANIIRQFRSGQIWILITTELLARGLDFPKVSTIINYDFPSSTASYIHRIGRTGRAGQPGRAITLFRMDDVDKLKIVVNVMRQTGCRVPEWLLSAKKPKNKYLVTPAERKRERNAVDEQN